MINLQEKLDIRMNNPRMPEGHMKSALLVKGFTVVFLEDKEYTIDQLDTRMYSTMCACTKANIMEGKNILYIGNRFTHVKHSGLFRDIIGQVRFDRRTTCNANDITIEERVIEGVPFILVFHNYIDRDMQEKIMYRDLRISEEPVEEIEFAENKVTVYNQNGFKKIPEYIIRKNIEGHLPTLKSLGSTMYNNAHSETPDNTGTKVSHNYGEFDINNVVYCEEDFMVTAVYMDYLDGTSGLSVSTIYVDTDDNGIFNGLILGDVHDGETHVMMPAGDKIVEVKRNILP